MYLRKTVETPWCIFRYQYHAARYGKKGKRRGNIFKSSEIQKAINKKIASQKRLWLICKYFSRDDYFLTFTYRRSERPENIDMAMRMMSKALQKLARKLKAKGIKLSYFHTCERGERGGVHHHVLIKNRFAIGDLFNADIWPYGKVIYEEVYSKGVVRLAEYFVKGDSESSEKKYSQSRDLITPKPKVEVIKSDGWLDKPRGKKGYDMVNLIDGIDGYAGKMYQGYMLVRRE